jgi:hypothetical protein
VAGILNNKSGKLAIWVRTGTTGMMPEAKREFWPRNPSGLIGGRPSLVECGQCSVRPKHLVSIA